MFYDALSGNTVKITLSKQDMSDYSLKSESIRSRTAESRRSLTRFLKKLQNESSLFPDLNAERLFLEAFPSDDGGCVMYVSTLGADTIPDPAPARRTRKLMCSAEDIGDLAGLSMRISGRISASSLYRLGRRYCLIIKTSPSDAGLVSHIISEYGELSDNETDMACTCEHGVPICRTGAVKILSALA